jgi:leader peptidase (prepilin peptidase)/N-methyltransferase
MTMAVFEVGAALTGACVGSFLNVVIWRLPQQDPRRRSLGGRSHCPKCGKLIRWFDNIPVAGWLLLRGRARCCGSAISLRYPLVELLTALLFLALAIWPHPSFGEPLSRTADGSLALHGEAAAGFVLHAVFVSLLVASTFIDFDHQLLPDALTYPGMAIGLLGGLWPGIAGTISSDPSTSVALRSVLASIAGLLTGVGVTWGIRALGSLVFRREAMGLGDVKFLGMIGAFLGWQGALMSLFLGCVSGAVFGVAALVRGGVALRIPFGPYLAFGALVTLFARDPIFGFLFETWPEWQQTSPSAPWLLLVVALFSLVALYVLVRRGRRLG